MRPMPTRRILRGRWSAVAYSTSRYPYRSTRSAAPRRKLLMRLGFLFTRTACRRGWNRVDSCVYQRFSNMSWNEVLVKKLIKIIKIKWIIQKKYYLNYLYNYFKLCYYYIILICLTLYYIYIFNYIIFTIFCIQYHEIEKKYF